MVQSGEFGLASPELAIQGFGPDNQSEPRVGIPPCQRPLRPIVSHFVPFRLRLASSSSEPRQYSLEILACSWVGNAIRLLRATAALLALAQGALFVHAQQPIPATQLIREVVFNELNDHRGHGYWRYWVQSRLHQETRVEDRVETAQGLVARLSLSDGRPLSAETEQQEQARLQLLLNSPGEQAKHRQQYDEDEKQIGRILAMLPDAFLFQYDGEENGCVQLRFQPNPVYPAHTIEARIFHALAGTICVDGRMKRLVRLDAHIEESVDFGYGILGRLYKGGWFQLQRTQVSPTEWKTERMEVHILARALFFKNFAHEISEISGGFSPVPAAMNLAQGMALLEQNLSSTQSKSHSPVPAIAPSRPELVIPSTLALSR